MTIHLSEHDAARLGIAGAKGRTTRGRNTRPDIPSAGRSPRTGLSTFLKAGWSIEFRVGVGYRLDKGALSSGWCVDEATCCAVAKELA